MNDLFSKEQLHELYINQGISVNVLCILYGVAESTIRKHLKEYGISREIEIPHTEVPHTWDPGFLSFYRSYRSDAIKRGYSFELTEQQFFMLINSNCHYCGIAPYKRSTYKRLIRNGIDRVDNAQGYTIENCRPCCHTCNFIKGSMSEQEFINCALRIAAHHVSTSAMSISSSS